MKKTASVVGTKRDFLTHHRGVIKDAMISIVPESMQKEVTDKFMSELASTVSKLHAELSALTEVPDRTQSKYVPFKFAKTESFVFSVCAAFICNHICESRLKFSPSKIDFTFIQRDAKALLISQSKRDHKLLETLKAAYFQVFIGDAADAAVGSATGDRQDPFAASRGLKPSESVLDVPVSTTVKLLQNLGTESDEEV